MTITFQTLFQKLVADTNALPLAEDFVKGSEGLSKSISKLVEAFMPLLSKEQIESLTGTAESILSSDDSELGDDECAIIIMLLENEELSADITVSPDDFDISKWEQVESNDWSWFASELWDYGVVSKIEHNFILKITHTDTTEIDTFALYTTSNKNDAEVAVFAVAQFFVGGTTGDRCFESTYGDRTTEQVPIDATEISKTEFDTYKKLGFRCYKELKDIPCNVEEVKNLWCDIKDENLDDRKDIIFHG